MALINNPPVSPVDRMDNGDVVEVVSAWRNFFQAVYLICFGVTQSGTTAQRPTERLQLWTGRPYYDTTLNRPIWWTGSQWIKADGTVV